MPMACSVLEMHVARSFGGADDEVAEPKAGGTLGWLVMACTRLTPCNQPFHQESINQSINRLTPCNPVNQSTNQPISLLGCLHHAWRDCAWRPSCAWSHAPVNSHGHAWSHAHVAQAGMVPSFEPRCIEQAPHPHSHPSEEMSG
mmetsp:Transcript_11759/g.23680  ORF Transcript_11759/g.23680 Transcript_11759/m.23680 type:complete len:144 (+) Transcript_11759:88-519(+)